MNVIGRLAAFLRRKRAIREMVRRWSEPGPWPDQKPPVGHDPAEHPSGDVTDADSRALGEFTP